ncbi:MAG: peptidase S10 [Proteobacteria bacterium]|nr:peptidase S10 [Pseudomonadota bacterium]
MKRAFLMAATAALGLTAMVAFAADAPAPNKPDAKADLYSGKFFKAQESVTTGAVNGISYRATAGTLVVHPDDWNDAAQNGGKNNPDAKKDASSPEASMFFVYYAKTGAPPETRPITFIFNGGPGSATVWLHMGAWGPKRIVTPDDSHAPAAPYQLVDNDSTLLDASDLVFIDAPGTGFSRIAGKDKEKAFYGIDADGEAFTHFILEFLAKYNRWNSPKFIFGESYGTPRAAVLVNDLENDNSVDFNGVIMLSQILNFSLSPDRPESNPGVNLPYQLALPTYAATAWYHNKLPGKKPADLHAFLQNVERFAMGEYAQALDKGTSLSAARRKDIATKLHNVTGLPVRYILKADLRIDGGEFRKNLLGDDLDTGRLDTRFSGPTLDPLSQRTEYDPQSSALSSAYVSAFNDYVRNTLHYGQGQTFLPSIRVFQYWNWQHKQPGARFASRAGANVMPDLANAMKQNPDLKVMLNGGYFDLATPYYQGWYEMHQLPIPQSLASNISYHYYQSGHMVYAHQASLKEMHDAVAAFIRANSNVK